MTEKIHPSPRAIVIVAIALLVVGFVVRSATLFNYRSEIDAVQWALTLDYQSNARLLAAGDLAKFVAGEDPPVDATVLWHAPGYSIFIAGKYLLLGESSNGLHLLQALLDALAAALVFFLATRFFSFGASALAGFLVAVSPQLSITSVTLLPEALSVIPIIGAVLLLIMNFDKDRIVYAIFAGVLLGISCWLRASGLFLPLFVAAFVLALAPRKRVKGALAVVFAAYIVVAPITVRNYVVFDAFVPISLGGGQASLEGVSQADVENRFALAKTDVEVAANESIEFGEPRYAGSSWNPDGVMRERARMQKVWQVIKTDPAWYFGVAIKRAVKYLVPQRTPNISPAVEFDPRSPAPARLVGQIVWWPQKIIYSPAVLLLAIALGLIFAFRNSSDTRWLLLLAVPVYTIAFHAFFYYDPRYVVSMWYFLLIFAAAGIWWPITIVAHKVARNGEL